MTFYPGTFSGPDGFTETGKAAAWCNMCTLSHTRWHWQMMYFHAHENPASFSLESLGCPDLRAGLLLSVKTTENLLSLSRYVENVTNQTE